MKLPEDFKTYTKELMGDKLYQQLEHGILEEESPTSIRINPFKSKNRFYSEKETKTSDRSESADKQEALAPIPWCPQTGRYLESRPSFTFDPLLHAGMYYVQEASSMFVDLVIRQLVHEPVMMLDLCAAPGGKSTCLRAALPEGSLLFSNEPMRTRSQILAENIQKFGHPDMIVTNNYPRNYKKSKLQFDVILTDVPCSGEGMFRKDEGAISEWSLQNVDNCWKLQREIVSDIWHCLKPGGILIYSTCTFNAHEDEENVTWIAEELGADFIPLNISSEWNITGNLIDKTTGETAPNAVDASNQEHPVYRFLPGKSKGEGLFLAVLRKHGDEEMLLANNATNDSKRKKKDKNKDKGKAKGNRGKGTDMPTDWLLSPNEENKEGCYETATDGDNLYAIPTRWKSIYDTATKSLKVIHAGIQLGTTKGKDLIPAQSLALSTVLNRKAFPGVELSYEDAIRYLRKEAVYLPEGTPKGYVLITYRQVPLGWEKNIGNRANNLYPQEWKIKSSHIPEEPICDKNIIM